MGWTWTRREAGYSHAEYFVQHGVLRWSNPRYQFRVLESATIDSTFYAAVERIDKQGVERKVFAVVILIRWEPKARDRNNFGYKDMDETCGPCEARCPERILKLLTPTTSPYAKDWRIRCQKWNTESQRNKALLVAGNILHLDNPIRLLEDLQVQDFELVELTRREVTAKSLGPDWQGRLFRIPRKNLLQRLVREVEETSNSSEAPAIQAA